MSIDDIKKTLNNYFAAQPVDAVYLFGSKVTNHTNPTSDTDIAVLFSAGLSHTEKFARRLQFASDIGKLIGEPDNIEVVDLETTPLPLRFSAVHPRQEILARNKSRRTLFEADTLSRYFDYAYYVRQNTLFSLPSIGAM